MQQQKQEPVVFRQIALPVSVFDNLKEAQRHFSKKGRELNNNQVLAILIGLAWEQLKHVENNKREGKQGI